MCLHIPIMCYSFLNKNDPRQVLNSRGNSCISKVINLQDSESALPKGQDAVGSRLFEEGRVCSTWVLKETWDIFKQGTMKV